MVSPIFSFHRINIDKYFKIKWYHFLYNILKIKHFDIVMKYWTFLLKSHEAFLKKHNSNHFNIQIKTGA